MTDRQVVFCLDFESTLVPEFWPLVAKHTGIDELSITTQDVPDFGGLMKRRIEILQRENITLSDLVKIAETIEPMDGAVEFINKLREASSRIFIVSDFADQLATPMLRQFGNLVFFGHKFGTNESGDILSYEFRQDNPKQKVVEAMQSLGYSVAAAGDSYNDITMLQAADKSYLFNAPPAVVEGFPQFPSITSYSELYNLLTSG